MSKIIKQQKELKKKWFYLPDELHDEEEPKLASLLFNEKIQDRTFTEANKVLSEDFPEEDSLLMN